MNYQPPDPFQILVVEDDESIRDCIALIAEIQNYDVQMASNGKIALDLLRSELRKPDLVLLDLMMPIMDGYQFKQALEKDQGLSNIPVVIMTAARETPGKFESLNAQGLIRKPFDLNDLLSTIESFKRRPSKR